MRFNRFAFVACLTLLLSAVSRTPEPAGAHDFHVSITDVRHNPEQKSLEVAVKIFTDDLESALEGLGAPPLRLHTEREHPKTDSLLARYLNHRIQFDVNDQQVTGNFLGKEYETDATWCYIEFADVPDPTTITVTNRLFFERFDDQSNLVHLEVHGKKKSLLLHIGMESDRAEF
ncbi:MAG: DUF6702 family protein [Bacteroidota bacterium]